MTKIKYFIVLFSCIILCSCGIYKFNATSIAPDVTSITVYPAENRAMKINPSLANTLTIALQDKYRKLTKLEMLDDGGDLEVETTITSYDVTATAVTSQEVAAQNRLTITVKISFTNKKYPDEGFDKSFAAYQDFDATTALDAVEAQLVDEIVEILVEDIFNATVANW
ncbi:MAG: LptE family protein [Bacteroidales bacterium]|nr:LptE family protein [Bacteroidales bacterium]